MVNNGDITQFGPNTGNFGSFRSLEEVPQYHRGMLNLSLVTNVFGHGGDYRKFMSALKSYPVFALKIDIL